MAHIQLGDHGRRGFQERGESSGVVQDTVDILAQYLGPELFGRVFSQPVDDLARVAAICWRSEIVRVVGERPGFATVRDKLAGAPTVSLNEPRGEWFQLLVGYLATAAGEEIAFERPIGESAPKDIVARADALNIECKAFETGEQLNRLSKDRIEAGIRIAPFLPMGDWAIVFHGAWSEGRLVRTVELLSSAPLDQLDTEAHGFRIVPWNDGFVTGLSGAIGYFGGAGNLAVMGPAFDEQQRVVSNVAEKHRQLIPGIANIIALDTTRLDSAGGLEGHLAEGLFFAEHNRRISALLLVASSAERARMVVRTSVVENPHAEQALPRNLADALSGTWRF